MLSTRLIVGLSMVGFLLFVLGADEWFAPWFPFWFLISLTVTGLSALELVGLLNLTSAKPSGNTVFGGTLALVIANWVPHITARMLQLPHTEGRLPYDPLAPINALAWPLLTFVAVLMFSFIAQSAQFQEPGRTMASISGTVLAVAYVGLLGSFVIQLRWLDGRFHGLFPLVYLVTVAKGSDTGAYTLGRLAGRHKLWPRLSPNKTIEGAVGGLVFGVLGALIISGIARFVLNVPALGFGLSVVYGRVVSAAAQLGDLMESMIKRDCERKDASETVPGFGGVLDIMDSLLFAGPAAFAFWMMFVP
jgi:phosphatidate cytidylyltransferase